MRRQRSKEETDAIAWRKAGYMVRILDGLLAAGATVGLDQNFSDEGLIKEVNGESVHFFIEEEMSGSGSYYARPSGKLRGRVRTNYKLHQFVEKKNGGIECAKIVALLLDVAKEQKDSRARRRDEQARLTENESALKELRLKHDLSDIFTANKWSRRPSLTAHAHGIDIEIDGLSPEQAGQVLEALAKILRSS